MIGAADWSGPVGDVWAAEWRRTDRSFAELEPHLEAPILACAPERCRHIVDLGCGAGITTLAIAAARANCTVTGIDLSPQLLAIAHDRAIGAANCRFLLGDAPALAAELAPVDLFVSRHGVMFFADPVAAFAALAASASPDARLVFSCFAERASNPWAIDTVRAVGGNADSVDGPGPFAFADPAHVAAVLLASGWRAEPPQRIDYRYVAGAGDDPVADAAAFFRRIGPAASALRAAPDNDRAARLARLTQICERHRDGARVAFPAAAWLWSARLTERRA